MHHYLHITEWFDEVLYNLRRLRLERDPHDHQMLKEPPVHVGISQNDVEPDHRDGREPEDVASDIFNGVHPRVRFESLSHA